MGKIKLLDISNKKECEKWEEFVLNNGYMYQSVRWIYALKSYKFQPYYLYFEKNGKIDSVLPLFHVKFFPFLNELVSIPHCEAGGFINPQYYELFFDYIAKNFNVKNVKIYQFNSEIDDFPKNDLNKIFLLNLPETIDGIYKLFKKRFKRSIENILKKTDVNVYSGNDDNFIKILYDLNVVKNKEFGTPHHSFNFISSFVKAFGSKSKIFVAKKNNIPIGASFIIHFGKIVYHIFHFIPKKYLKEKVGLILFFYMFQYCLEKNIKIFSLGRSPENSGTFKFKKETGAEIYPLNLYNFKIKNSKLVAEKPKILQEKYQWAADIWSKLPSPITNFLSPIIRKWVY